jgi:hypothetical protein
MQVGHKPCDSELASSWWPSGAACHRERLTNNKVHECRLMLLQESKGLEIVQNSIHRLYPLEKIMREIAAGRREAKQTAT